MMACAYAGDVGIAVRNAIVAYHEAGHALVAALTPDCAIEYVTILEDDESHGHTRKTQRVWASQDKCALVLREIQCLLAGFIAESLILPPRDGSALESSRLDRQEAYEIAVQVTESQEDATAVLIVAFDRARDELQDSWHGVRGLARELMRHGRIDGGDVLGIVLRATP